MTNFGDLQGPRMTWERAVTEGRGQAGVSTTVLPRLRCPRRRTGGGTTTCVEYISGRSAQVGEGVLQWGKREKERKAGVRGGVIDTWINGVSLGGGGGDEEWCERCECMSTAMLWKMCCPTRSHRAAAGGLSEKIRCTTKRDPDMSGISMIGYTILGKS